MVWITGGGLVISLLMIVGLLILVVMQGLFTSWPPPVVEYETTSGEKVMGEITRTEEFTPMGSEEQATRYLVRTGNFELTGEHFKWVNDFDIKAATNPDWVLVLERVSWGRFYGFPMGFLVDGELVSDKPERAWELYKTYHDAVADRRARVGRLETHDIGKLNLRLEHARLEVKKAIMEHGEGSPEAVEAAKRQEVAEKEVASEFAEIQAEISKLEDENKRYAIRFDTAEGKETTIAMADIVRAYPANQLSFFGKLQVYGSRWLEFLTAEPREANSEGGVFPAIFGTVVMTLIMSLAVVPFGVMAALYLREYAKAGPVVSAVRISINNLAGVPSIVFGVFGLGFFCYVVGASLDELLFAAKLPNPTYGKGGILWASLTLALMTLPVVIVATEEALSAVPNSMREGSYACGASKWQTIKRIVLPRAMPGIMTGMILAMARGAGEVAPLMLVGAVKLAPELPIDSFFPYIHPERSFMHLGFHIYDLGFQSQNSEAAKPMVFTTTLLLIAIIFLLNIFAVRLRTRLRKKFVSAVF